MVTNLQDTFLSDLYFTLATNISEAFTLKSEDTDFAQGAIMIWRLKCSLEIYGQTLEKGNDIG